MNIYDLLRKDDMNPQSKTALDSINGQFEELLKDAQTDTTAARNEFSAYIAEITPLLDTAITEGSLFALKYLRDAIAGKFARISLDWLQARKDQIVLIIETVLRTVIMLAAA